MVFNTTNDLFLPSLDSMSPLLSSPSSKLHPCPQPPPHSYPLTHLLKHPQPLAIEHNHTKAITFIRTAASRGCDLAVLPEYHLTNWLPRDPSFISLCAQSPKYLASYQALARDLKICIVPGTLVEVRPDPSNPSNKPQLVNVAYFISSDGSISGAYTKKNLWHPERAHLTSSLHDPHIAFDTPLGKIGMLICWDLAFPEAFRELISQGAQIIIVPTFWNLNDCSAEGLAYNPLSEQLFLESTLISRAYENTCAVIFVNSGGPPAATGKKSSGNYAGLSQVAVPFIGALGKMGREEGMQIVDLDMRILEAAEGNYKVREDMRREGWHYGFAMRGEAGYVEEQKERERSKL